MADALYPTADFDRVALDVKCIAPRQSFIRIFPRCYNAPLGYGDKPSRFSDPRPTEDRFKVLYAGCSLDVSFLEAFLRDKRNRAVGAIPISESELAGFYCAIVQALAEPLRLVDLRSNGRIRMGIPSQVLDSSHDLSRHWSLAIYRHPANVDGIIYPSRLNSDDCIAVYDRAVRKLTGRISGTLMGALVETDILEKFRVALIP